MEKNLEELKKEVVKALLNGTEKSAGEQEQTEAAAVELKKAPSAIAMRIFKEDEDYENQIMRECEAFFEKYGMYPNAIVSSPLTLDRWQSQIEDCAAENTLDEELEHMTFAQIKAMEEQAPVCEIGPSEDGKATLFKTSEYELFLIQNEDYQDGVYQLLFGYSPVLENGTFSYPVIDMEATGKKIRQIADAMGISPVEIQKVCGLGSLQAVYKWFGGKSVPTVDNLGILSNLLNTPIDDLLVYTNREVE